MSIILMRFRQFLSKQTSGIKNLDVVWRVLIASWVLFFFWNIVGAKYTGWDTHDIGFVNFLYFSDALRSLSLPLWNPLIQSGTFYPTFFNAGSYTPFQWIFISLSYVINPVYAYELMIQASVLIGAVGFYLLLRTGGNNKYVALFGANAFFLSALMPITGQIGLVISLGALPWLLLFCHEILLGELRASWTRAIFWASIAASFMASGYPWMNIVDLAITFFYACNLVWLNRAKLTEPPLVELGRLVTFLAGVAILLLCYYLPGYLSMKFNYQALMGDYLSPEPRLRSLRVSEYLTYSGLTEALVSAIDPRILKHSSAMTSLPLWSLGAGLVVWMALFYERCGKWFIVKNYFWIAMLIFWMCYSAGKISVVEEIPLFNANRWLFIGQFYVSICLIFIAVNNLQHGFYRNQTARLSWTRLVVISVGIFAILVCFSAPILVFMLAACAVILFYYLLCSGDEKKWQEAMLLLICLNATTFISMPITLDKFPVETRFLSRALNNNGPDYGTFLEHRVKTVNITENVRHIDAALEYVFNDENWLLNKFPVNHGYNPLGNPLYWYLKSEAFTRNLVSMTQSVRMERPLQRRNFVSDNAYMDALVEDVRSDETSPTVDRLNDNAIKRRTDFQWTLTEFMQEPNVATIKVTANDEGYLLFSNTYFPEWEVFVDNKKADLIKVNRVFMGVYLDKPGEHKIVFRFFPLWMVTLLLLPFAVMLTTLLFGVKQGDLKRSLFPLLLVRNRHAYTAGGEKK